MPVSHAPVVRVPPRLRAGDNPSSRDARRAPRHQIAGQSLGHAIEARACPADRAALASLAPPACVAGAPATHSKKVLNAFQTSPQRRGRATFQARRREAAPRPSSLRGDALPRPRRWPGCGGAGPAGSMPAAAVRGPQCCRRVPGRPATSPEGPQTRPPASLPPTPTAGPGGSVASRLRRGNPPSCLARRRSQPRPSCSAPRRGPALVLRPLAPCLPQLRRRRCRHRRRRHRRRRHRRHRTRCAQSGHEECQKTLLRLPAALQAVPPHPRPMCGTPRGSECESTPSRRRRLHCRLRLRRPRRERRMTGCWPRHCWLCFGR